MTVEDETVDTAATWAVRRFLLTLHCLACKTNVGRPSGFPRRRVFLLQTNLSASKIVPGAY